jgi:DNA invertase Pin-like site-specific DNA recombinase
MINIAAYLRVSREDDSKDESNSIKNQRDLIRRYITGQDDLRGAEIVEYIDDGVSGSHTDRAGYQRLMDDIGKGRTGCVCVKDLSRIGRSLIDVDDLLMNRLIALQVRFIAINNHYDSLLHPLSNLELAIINLGNQYYNRDLAVKSISAKRVKMRRGEFLSCWVPFGYKKSATERNKIVVDDEAAGYIRQIFQLAIDGIGPTKIAATLNERGIPTPSEYKRRHGVTGGWRITDPEYTFWTVQMVRKLVLDVRYTGSSLNNVYRQKQSGGNRCARRPKDEWIIMPNAHEAIVS